MPRPTAPVTKVGWWSENKDPIRLLGQYMVANRVAKQAELDALYEQVEREVLDAIEFGKESDFPPARTSF